MSSEILEKEIQGMTDSTVRYVCPVDGRTFTDPDEYQAYLKTFQRVEEGRAVVTLELQAYIPAPPLPKDNLKQIYSSNDGVTITTWWEEWKKNKIANCEGYKILDNLSLSEHGKWAARPVIIAGSGPSLKKNAHLLKERNEVGLVSALHNFGFFEEIGVKPDYYLNLDAGDITIYEAAEGDPEIYEAYKGMSDMNKVRYLDKINFWERTEGHTLLAAIHSNPELIKRWKGKILWFDTALAGLNEETKRPELKDMKFIYQTGGNTLGACHYHAKAILGASQVVFVGADFAFGYEKKFHSWDSPYDAKFDGLMPATDIYGQPVWTWPSYFGFKNWFEFQSMGGLGNTPGTYVNCTEGGILGSYPQGNIMQIRQRRLKEFLSEINLHRILPSLLEEKGLTALY